MRIRTAILSSVILLGIVAAGASLFVLRSGSDNESGVVIPAGEGRILFFSNRTGSTEIYSINPDGEGLKHLTASPGNATSPAWSPDGSQIAYLFIGETLDKDGIYVVNAAGGERRRVALGASSEGTPAWLPDGAEIIFGCQPHICITGASESETKVLIPDALSSQASGSVSASPDGRHVVFARDGDLYVSEVDGTDRRQLTTDGRLNFKPRWSPDGSQMLFTSTVTGEAEIHVMNTDGSEQV